MSSPLYVPLRDTVRVLVDIADDDGRLERGGLTELRSRRTSTVQKGARAAAYTTGLAQAEELWTAARGISALASPILRYYALAQAAQAVIACSPLSNSVWRARGGHGLTLRMTQTASGERLKFDDVMVAANGEGIAPKLAEALDTPLLTTEASLSELIAALPMQRYLRGAPSLPPRPIVGDVSPGVSTGDSPQLTLHVLPPAVAAALSAVPKDETGPLRPVVANLFSRYSGLASLPTPTRLKWEAGDPEFGPRLTATFRRSELPTLDAWAPYVDMWDSSSSSRGSSWWNSVQVFFLPTVAGNPNSQHPLMTWYLVLYAYSMLARYYAADWRRRLDVDNDTDAAALIEHVGKGSDDALDLAGNVIRAFLRTDPKATA